MRELCLQLPRKISSSYQTDHCATKPVNTTYSLKGRDIFQSLRQARKVSQSINCVLSIIEESILVPVGDCEFCQGDIALYLSQDNEDFIFCCISCGGYQKNSVKKPIKYATLQDFRKYLSATALI
jgi:hypothetical protein